MPTPKKLTPALEDRVLAHTAAGKSNRWIAAWLKRAKGISISHVQVGQVVREARSARADAAKVVVREELKERLPRDLQIFDERIGALVADIRKIEDVLAPMKPRAKAFSKLEQLKKSLLGELRKCIDTKLHYVGADQPDEKIEGLAELLGSAFG